MSSSQEFSIFVEDVHHIWYFLSSGKYWPSQWRVKLWSAQTGYYTQQNVQLSVLTKLANVGVFWDMIKWDRKINWWIMLPFEVVSIKTDWEIVLECSANTPVKGGRNVQGMTISLNSTVDRINFTLSWKRRSLWSYK